MAASVTVSAGAGAGEIVLTADAGIVGIGLTVEGGPVTDVAVDSFFDVFIDSAFTIGAGYVVGDGVPTAIQTGAGELALPSSSFSISVGGLDDDGIGEGAEEAPTTTTITLSGSGTVTIDEDTLRGGIVGYDGAMEISGLPLQVDLGTTPTCRDNFGATAQALYDRYVNEGADPSVWCNQYQCYGDANDAEETIFLTGTFRVYQQDLNILVASWKKVPENGADPRADFNHAEETIFLTGTFSVYQQDLNKLVTNWKATTADLAVLGNCPECMPYF
jgi:hypothetical protein